MRVFVSIKRLGFAVTIVLITLSAAKLQGQNQPTATASAPDSAARAGRDGVSVPSCKYAPPPRYSKEARKAKYEGIVVVEVIIELDGKLSNMRVVKSPGYGLDVSALEALKKWRCAPATGPSGKPVRTSVPIEISFRLGPGA